MTTTAVFRSFQMGGLRVAALVLVQCAAAATAQDTLFPLVQTEPEVAVTTGKRSVVIPLSRMANGHGFPDMPVAFLPSPPLQFLMVCGNDTFLWGGKTLEEATLIRNVLPPGPKGSVDNNYAGISSVFHDAAKNRILAFYHAEDSEDMERLSLNGVPGFYGRICVAESPVGQAVFKKLGPAISSDTPKRLRPWETEGGPKDAWLGQGVGSPYVFTDGDGKHLLCMYGEWGNRFRNNRGVQVNVARAPIESAGLPGSWVKFYRGKFSEVGLGGHETPVLSGAPHGDAIDPQVQYVEGWERYVMVFSLNVFSEVQKPQALKHSGVYVSTSTDAINWSKPVRADSILTMFLNGYECMMHPFLIIDSVAADKLSGKLMYRYSKKWPDDQGCLCARPITITKLASATTNAVKRPLPTRSESPAAFVFDGKSTIVTPVKRKVPITLEMWIKPDGQEADVFFVGSSSLSHQGIGIGLNKSQLRAQHLIGDFGCGEIVAPGRWHHVAGTFDVDASHLFLNGRQVATGPGNKEADDSPVFVIGDIGTLYSGHHFKGEMRAVRVTEGIRYTHDFTPPDRFIAQKSDSGGKTLLLYDAAETHADEATDLSGDNAHGRRIGATVRVEK